jgi:hypothetical protein
MKMQLGRYKIHSYQIIIIVVLLAAVIFDLVGFKKDDD